MKKEKAPPTSRAIYAYFIGFFVFSSVILVLCSLLLDYNLGDYIEILVIPIVLQPIITYFIIKINSNRIELLNDENIRHNLSDEELINIYHMETPIKRKGQKMAAITLDLPEERMTIDDISISLTQKRYEPPKNIVQYQKEILQINKNYYNSFTLRLNDFERNGTDMVLKMAISDYVYHTITNNSPDFNVERNLTIRDLLEPGPYLMPLDQARASNHLGINVLIISKDEKCIIPVRSKKVTFDRETLSPSLSFAVNYHRVFREGELQLLNSINFELGQELDCEIPMDEIIYIGLIREFRRLGKPEMYFISRCPKTSKEIQKILEKESAGNEESKDFKLLEVEKLLSTEDIEDWSVPLQNIIAVYDEVRSKGIL